MNNTANNPTNPSAMGFGVNLWWTVPAVKVDQNIAAALLIKHGFDKDDMPPPTDREEISRAVDSMQDLRHKHDRRIKEKVYRDGEKTVWGILERVQTDKENADFKQKTKVTYFNATNRVTVTGKLVQEVNDRIAEFRDKITDDDVRKFLLNVNRRCRGIAKRPTGGIYFVPAANVGIIDRAQAFLTELGTVARLYVERVVDGPQERKNVWEAVEEDLDEKLDKIMFEVERTAKRATKLVGQQKNLDEAREMMEVYQKLLGEEAKHQEIATKIEVVVKAIGDKMTVFAEAKQEKETKKTRKGKHGKGQKKVRATGFEEAVVKVMAEAGASMHILECVARIKAEVPEAVVPARPDAYLWRMAKTGKLTMEGKGVFGLAKTA